ncbi:hypothetical protein GW17_00047448 [Ensete ventricosum]|nr:hypothetical protein GW17_00047448 [Ensete ventricosum]
MGDTIADSRGTTIESTLKTGYGWYNHQPRQYNYRLLLGFLGGGGIIVAHKRFSATPDNLSISLGLLPTNSPAPSWQAPDTLGKLPVHSRRVPNRIVLTTARCLDLTLAKPLIVIISLS